MAAQDGEKVQYSNPSLAQAWVSANAVAHPAGDKNVVGVPRDHPVANCSISLTFSLSHSFTLALSVPSSLGEARIHLGRIFHSCLSLILSHSLSSARSRNQGGWCRNKWTALQRHSSSKRVTYAAVEYDTRDGKAYSTTLFLFHYLALL